jgi:hypothetical protein
MRSYSAVSLPSTPSGLGARELRRAMDLSAEVVSGRPTPTTYEDLWGSTWRQPRHKTFGEGEHGAFWLSPVFATFLAVILGSMSLVGLKEEIVRAFPASGTLYAAAGLPVNLQGLEFRGFKSRISADGSQRLLKVQGEIANLRPGLSHVPAIELVVQGEDGRALYRWTAAASKPKLGAKETIAFEARLVSPPAGGRDVKVRFAQAN